MSSLDFPAAILLLLLFACFAIVIRAQRRADFDWGDALRDDTGKVSAMRLGVLVCLVISSWVLVDLTLKYADKDPEKLLYFYLIYVAVWSGAKIVEKLLEAKFGASKNGGTP